MTWWQLKDATQAGICGQHSGPAPHGWRSGNRRKNRDSRRDGALQPAGGIDMGLVDCILVAALAVVVPLLIGQCIGAMGENLKQADDAWTGGDDDRS